MEWPRLVDPERHLGDLPLHVDLRVVQLRRDDRPELQGEPDGRLCVALHATRPQREQLVDDARARRRDEHLERHRIVNTYGLSISHSSSGAIAVQSTTTSFAFIGWKETDERLIL